ncbi:hypothetical protein TRFO_42180 [Tritrichomonas foetus]|uniref:Uncharacterized protein n=1 Tax=Tritrichomonas foetus TaxID=1144522 RepID=A0A1J4KXF2_9EUKA|nr:hypothetical protein TRFO_42180 [Tritrichomonas foetus]|eukprot:OHT15919.1 hypothetical protein TRFO_42180 [Tritrichomonas foetus]
MISLILLFKSVFSLAEDQFLNGDQCYCAILPNQCNPFCSCDPFCAQSQKESFPFTLPQKLGENDIACDNTGQIRRMNSNSVIVFKPANSTLTHNCYVYQKPPSKNDFIKTYLPESFGLLSFANATTELFIPPSIDLSISQSANTPYVVVNPTDNYSFIRIPHAIGSNFANVFLPYIPGVTYTNNLCYLGHEYPSQQFFFTIWTNPGSYERNNITISILFNGLPYLKLSSSLTDGASFQTVALPGFNYGLQNSTLKVDVVSDQIDYTQLASGYIPGYPVYLRNIVNVREGFNPLNFTNQGDLRFPVLFGVNSEFVFSYQYNASTFIQDFNLSEISGTANPDSGENIAPVFYNLTQYPVDGINFIKVRWTFFYQKHGTDTNFNYYIRKAITEMVYPTNINNTAPYTTTVESVFYEINIDGTGLYQPPEPQMHQYTLATVFTVFFNNQKDILKTSGVFTSFLILGTIWVYYAFNFVNE